MSWIVLPLREAAKKVPPLMVRPLSPKIVTERKTEEEKNSFDLHQ